MTGAEGDRSDHVNIGVELRFRSAAGNGEVPLDDAGNSTVGHDISVR